MASKSYVWWLDLQYTLLRCIKKGFSFLDFSVISKLKVYSEQKREIGKVPEWPLSTDDSKDTSKQKSNYKKIHSRKLYNLGISLLSKNSNFKTRY